MSEYGVEVVEATHREAAKVAAGYLRMASKALADEDIEHALVWIDSALVWLGER